MPHIISAPGDFLTICGPFLCVAIGVASMERILEIASHNAGLLVLQSSSSPGGVAMPLVQDARIPVTRSTVAVDIPLSFGRRSSRGPS